MRLFSLASRLVLCVLLGSVVLAESAGGAAAEVRGGERRVVERRVTRHRVTRHGASSSRGARVERGRVGAYERRPVGRVYLGGSPMVEVGGAVLASPGLGVGTGLSLVGGYRFGALGVAFEGVFASGVLPDGQSALRDLNLQLRAYLPLSSPFEIFPFVGVGEAEVGGRLAASHLDLGVGAQLRVGEVFRLGGRYGARVLAEAPQGVVMNAHVLVLNVGFIF